MATLPYRTNRSVLADVFEIRSGRRGNRSRGDRRRFGLRHPVLKHARVGTVDLLRGVKVAPIFKRRASGQGGGGTAAEKDGKGFHGVEIKRVWRCMSNPQEPLLQMAVPAFDVLRFFFEQLVGGIEDFDGRNRVASANRIHDFQSLGDFAKDGVFTIEMRRRAVRNEELAAIGRWSAIRHGKNAGFRMFERGSKFIDKRIARAARAGAVGIAALDHEIGNDAMELQSIVITPGRQVQKICDRDRGLISEKGEMNVAFVRFEEDSDVCHGSGRIPQFGVHCKELKPMWNVRVT